MKIERCSNPQCTAPKGLCENSISNDMAGCKNYLQGGYSYFADHEPTEEDWYILGIDIKGDRVCTAGYPPSIGKLSDCKNIEKNKPLEGSEIEYRNKAFGLNWL